MLDSLRLRSLTFTGGENFKTAWRVLFSQTMMVYNKVGLFNPSPSVMPNQSPSIHTRSSFHLTAQTVKPPPFLYYLNHTKSYDLKIQNSNRLTAPAQFFFRVFDPFERVSAERRSDVIYRVYYRSRGVLRINSDIIIGTKTAGRYCNSKTYDY